MNACIQNNENYDMIYNNQEYVYIKPTKYENNRIDLSLTYEEFNEIKHGLESLMKYRISARKYVVRTKNCKPKNKKKPIYLLVD